MVQEKANKIMDDREQNMTITIKQKVVLMEEHFSEYKILIVTENQTINISNSDLFVLQKSNSTLDFQGPENKEEKAP